MKKLLAFLKRIPNIYYRWKNRNEKLEEFLQNSDRNHEQLTHIDNAVTNLQTDLTTVKSQVTSLEQRVDQINGRIETLGRGAKMELFDTLHNWRVILVAEKKEVENIWKVYHEELGGNGQGERYYNEIMALPESEEELNQK